jgi:hypothetical protein
MTTSLATTTPIYRCEGSVRGFCGVDHTSLAAAIRHLMADQGGCRSLGGGAYSDRHIRVYEHDAEGEMVQRAMTEDEHYELDQAYAL